MVTGRLGSGLKWTIRAHNFDLHGLTTWEAENGLFMFISSKTCKTVRYWLDLEHRALVLRLGGHLDSWPA